MAPPLAKVRSIWKNILATGHPLRFLVALGLKRTGMSPLFDIPQQGFTLRFHPSSLAAHLWADPRSRDEDQRLLRALLRPGDTVIDLGANIGLLTLTALERIGPTGHVLAVEANPRTFGWLCENLALNHVPTTRCTPLQVAVGERSGTIHFSNDRDDEDHVQAGGALQVPMTTLDTIADSLGRIALLKIDVEGYELPALRAGQSTLARTDVLYIELSDRMTARFGYSRADLVAFLKAQGFGLYVAIGERQIAPRVADGPHAEVENVIALRAIESFRKRTGWEVVGVGGDEG